MADQGVVEFTEANFDAEVLRSELPVLVDFWAPWCGPCKLLGPIVGSIAGEYGGRVKVGKVNIDAAPQVASRYAVSSIPTLLFVKNGRVASQHVGALARKALAARIDQLLL
jgi:thioredoxin 1